VPRRKTLPRPFFGRQRAGSVHEKWKNMAGAWDKRWLRCKKSVFTQPPVRWQAKRAVSRLKSHGGRIGRRGTIFQRSLSITGVIQNLRPIQILIASEKGDLNCVRPRPRRNPHFQVLKTDLLRITFRPICWSRITATIDQAYRCELWEARSTILFSIVDVRVISDLYRCWPAVYSQKEPERRKAIAV
jgi:hypothetical protein